MMNLFAYPYPNYVSNKVTAGCVAAIVGLSLIAWFIQSCQTRFRPVRISLLLLVSHLTIFAELIVHATINTDEENLKKTVFIVVYSLFAIGQRMIIIGNFSFVLEIHHEKSCLSRGILAGAVVGVFSSGILMAPANTYSFEPDQNNTSFLYRELSASILLAVTVLFYVVLYWSKTINDMTMQGITLIIVSSVLCLTVAVFNMIQSVSEYYYTEINSHEGWFYGFQMAPIIAAHCAWSIFHPKRSLGSTRSSALATCGKKELIDEEQLVERV